MIEIPLYHGPAGYRLIMNNLSNSETMPALLSRSAKVNE